ncbi:protein-disulfide reductase DsbD family protein [Rhodoferax fermentans]|uniref:Protein-disulfide reductase n=1 Tax=Rhodoferax fermentans TaxID=28066 RepID=A0A1T1AU86_RHOFE|nr:thioredoxin family protein [Rhodoferax fermentans]MBK1685770.1 protein-disulfide reductase [Rhodoferax fermentans]OOV07669.1 protein-disulfide reductase [Rhodoferax fermentans]
MTFPQNLTRWLIAALFIAISPLSSWAQAPKSITNVVTTEQVRAELMAYAPDGIDPGKTVWVGLQLAHQPHWHTYWKNSGDSGQPTSLSWTLPTGVLAGDIAWPTPKILPTGNLVTYGFNGTVLLPVPLTITPDFKPSPLSSELEVKLQASWLVCKLECVPQDGEFVLRLPTKSSTALNAGVFEASFQASPKPLAGQSQINIEGQQLKLTVSGLPTTLQGQKLELFPEVTELVDAGAPWTQAWSGAVWTASLPISPHRSDSPTALPVVLVSDVAGQRNGFVTTAPITGSWPANPPPGQAEVAQPQLNPALKPIPAAPAVPTSFWLALFGALLGGLLLNLMPCVFPVLAIKVVGFTRHADDRHGHRMSGLAYSAGVVLSFLALGALMLVLRSAGEQLGWGFQLQSPAVVAALAALFTLIGLNLAGLFEFGQLLPSRLATLQSSNPAVNAFLSGVLAVAIASPCTAPFMGASLGLALALPPLQALLLFAALGVGMALPYLAASWSPALARKLPRPGPWMDTFRRAMAFPMFATVVWLVWVLGQQTGIDGAGALLALLVSLALVIWAFTLRGATRLPVAAVSIAILLTLTWAIGKNVVHFAEPNSTASTSTNSRWQAWAPGKVDELLASGSPVFVDFTAAWCVTCQYNKKTTLANTDLLADLDAKKVVLLRADWTRRDPAITTALAALGRNGVPVYVMYQPGKAPVVLSEILSVADVRGAMVGL